VYWRTRFAARPTRAELNNLFLDSVLLGAWSAALGFPTWITYAMLGATTLNAVVNRGLPGFALALACSAAGALLWALVRGVDYMPHTSTLVTALAIAGTFGYLAAVGYVVHSQSRRLMAARDALAREEERYRLIAENAGDLIAMVDPEGRWLYTSPSYEKVLEAADLAPGVDAFRNLHPSDAEATRVAILRASVTAKTRQVALRLVDKDGRLRQYKTWIHGITGNGPPRLLLVSQDVTDLRESEERVLLAAHAFEGMTEGIVITASDGTIVTVNRAFCEMTGLERDDLLGQSEKSLRNALQSASYYDDAYATVVREGHWSGTSWARRKNGSVYREWRSIRAVRESGGAVTHYVIVASEVDSPRSAAETTVTRNR
jgi:PAS domain S-box-containing protein